MIGTMLLTVAEQVVVVMKIADVRGDAGQPARPSKAATEAGASSAFSVICTVGPGRKVVFRALRPARLLRPLFFVILISPGEHSRPLIPPWKLGKAVPVTMRELGWPVAEPKFQNLLSPKSPGSASKADGPVGETLGFPPKQFWHSWMTRAPTCLSERKNTGTSGNGMGKGVWSTMIVNALLMACTSASPSFVNQTMMFEDS
jgi:hypothetical protein